MYLKMFGFQEKPFHITPNPRFIFLSKKHKEAFAHLLYGIQQRVGFLLLTGEVGTGKTTVLRTLLKQLEQSDYQVALIFNPSLTSLELLQSIHREFSIPYQDGESNFTRLYDSLNHFLLEQRKQGKTVVLVIDEAQNLDVKVLEQLRLLSNLETETDKLLQLIIVGQPELDEVLAQYALRQLKQRIIVRYSLSNMDAEDTFAYVNHRLKVAGYSGEKIFTEKAMQKIYRLTGGLPRLINILCDRALLVAYSCEASQVDHKIIAQAQTELSEARVGKVPYPKLIAGLALLMCVTALLYVQPWTPTRLLSPSDIISEAAVPSAEIVPQKIVPAPKSFPVDLDFLHSLEEKIHNLSETESAAVAVSGILNRWSRSVQYDYTAGTYRSLEKSLHDTGMSTIRFQNDSEELLNFNTPAILTIILPNISGKRFLAVLETKDGKVYTEPALTEDGWFPAPYLEKIWFSNAVIPWENFEQVPFIDDPGQEGSAVVSLQKLLIRAGYPDLQVTGVYDSETISAVSHLQGRTGLNPDGRIGGMTLLQLYRMAGYMIPTLTGEVSL